MKQKYRLMALAAGMSLMMSGCSDYLKVDKYFNDRLTLEKVFADKDYIENWLANTYAHLEKWNQDVTKYDNPVIFADDMYFTDQGGTAGASYRTFKNATYSETWYYETWGECYKGINKATIFLNNIDANRSLEESERMDYKAQARFVRAYFYWILLRKYGPIPLVPENGSDFTQSYDDLSIPRNTYDECAAFIADEMIEAAKDLPLKRDLRNIARPTRGAALATRAKVYLYAASPLMNGNQDEYANRLVDDKGNRLLDPEYDESKWAKAAAAARDVMELGVYQIYTAKRRTTGNAAYPATIVPYDDKEFSTKNWPDGYADIDPFESYRSTFNGELNAYSNPEIIFTRGQNQDAGVWSLVLHQLPRYANGWNCDGITQKQCDAYYQADGTDIPGKDKELGRGDGSERRKGFVTQEDVEAGKYKPLVEGVSLQYADREPRFYASVAYNGCVWHLTSADKPERREYTCWYYRGKQDGRTNTVNWLMTGIGVMKYVKPSDTNESNGKISDKTEPAIRYADILLMYAEALNELDGTYQIPSWDGSTTYTISRSKEEMERGIHPIRIRAGIPDYPDAVYEDKDLFRKKLKRERQIELFAETQRYYDIRRWKDAPEEETTPVYGCNTLATESDRELFHTPVAVPFLPTVFAEKTYFWPIHLDELKKNRRLTQNPGWNYND